MLNNPITIVGLLAKWSDNNILPGAATIICVESSIYQALTAHLETAVKGSFTHHQLLVTGSTGIIGLGPMWQDDRVVTFVSDRSGRDHSKKGTNAVPITEYTLHANLGHAGHPKLLLALLDILRQAGCPAVRAWGPPAKTSQHFIRENISPTDLIALLKKKSKVPVGATSR